MRRIERREAFLRKPQVQDVDYAGAQVVIGFNARYFLDVLGAIDDEEVVLGIGGDLDPAVLKPATESDDQSYKAVVMPMRI